MNGMITCWISGGADLTASLRALSCWARKLDEDGTSSSATVRRMRLTSLLR